MFDILMMICTITGIICWTTILILAAAYSLGFVEIGTDMEEAEAKRD
jgi:amino acid permease